jgi:hypothetical protein
VDEHAWNAALRMAAPRVMVAHDPHHQRFNWVLGQVRKPFLIEPTAIHPEWISDNEAVVFRFLYPVEPDQILADAPYAIDTEASTPESTRPESPAEVEVHTGQGDLRPNPLLEEAFRD